MAVYGLIDMQVTDDGDLILDDLGDIKVATPLRTVLQAINNALLTNKGELLTDPTFGANLQAYYGESNNDHTRLLMESDIQQEISRQGLVDPSDFNVDVIPIDIDEVAIMTDIKGQFIETESSGNIGAFAKIDGGITMSYIYPFTSGIIRALT